MSSIFTARKDEEIIYKAYLSNAPFWSYEVLDFVCALKHGADAVYMEIKINALKEPDKSLSAQRIDYRKPAASELKKLGFTMRPDGKIAVKGANDGKTISFTDYGYEYNTSVNEIHVYMSGRYCMRITPKNADNYLKIFSMGPELYEAATFDRNMMTFRTPPGRLETAVKEYQQLAALPPDKLDKAINGLLYSRFGNVNWYIKPEKKNDPSWPYTEEITISSRKTGMEIIFYMRGLRSLYISSPFGRVFIYTFRSQLELESYIRSLCRSRGPSLTNLAKAMELCSMHDGEPDSSKMSRIRKLYHDAPWSWVKELVPDKIEGRIGKPAQAGTTS